MNAQHKTEFVTSAFGPLETIKWEMGLTERNNSVYECITYIKSTFVLFAKNDLDQ